MDQTTRDLRNLCAWADRIMAGGYGKSGTPGYRNAVFSWRENYRAFRDTLPPMPPIIPDERVPIDEAWIVQDGKVAARITNLDR